MPGEDVVISKVQGSEHNFYRTLPPIFSPLGFNNDGLCLDVSPIHVEYQNYLRNIALPDENCARCEKVVIPNGRADIFVIDASAASSSALACLASTSVIHTWLSKSHQTNPVVESSELTYASKPEPLVGEKRKFCADSNDLREAAADKAFGRRKFTEDEIGKISRHGLNFRK